MSGRAANKLDLGKNLSQLPLEPWQLLGRSYLADKKPKAKLGRRL